MFDKRVYICMWLSPVDALEVESDTIKTQFTMLRSPDEGSVQAAMRSFPVMEM